MPFYGKFEQLVRSGKLISFYITELTQLEIHSVLGKYRRGVQSQLQRCERLILDQGAHVQCGKQWATIGRKRMNPLVYRGLLRLITDVESQRGEIQATVINFDHRSIAHAKSLLSKYSDRYSFSSHDAVIAGSLIAARELKGLNLTLITSDKGLKAALKEEGLPHIDPCLL